MVTPFNAHTLVTKMTKLPKGKNLITMPSRYKTVNTNFDCWVKDPRWSWYGTPLWKCYATLLTMSTVSKFRWKVNDVIEPQRCLLISSVYLTKEEYVMWKLKGYEVVVEMQQLRKGIIYVNG